MKSKIQTLKKVTVLNNCDLINKYNIEHFYKIPKIEKVKVKLSFKKLLDQIDLSSIVDKKDVVLKTKLFIIFAFFFNTPLLKNQVAVKDTKNQRVVSNETEDVTFNISITNKQEILRVLMLLFIENQGKTRTDKDIFEIKNILHNKIEFNVCLKKILDLFYLFNVKPFSLNIQEISIPMSFTITNANTKEENLFKNLPFFWLN